MLKCYHHTCTSRYFVEIPPVWETDQSLANVHKIAVDQSVAQYTGGLVKVSVRCIVVQDMLYTLSSVWMGCSANECWSHIDHNACLAVHTTLHLQGPLRSAWQ